MRQVVIDKIHIVAGARRQDLSQPLGDIQTLAQLRARGGRPGFPARGRELDRVLQNTVEREHRIFVEHHRIERLGPADLVDAIGDRRFGIAAVVFLSGEALLLRRGEDLAVAHHGCGGIVIKAGNAEDRRHAERACSAGCAAEASSPA
jgi:hypothetical protein